MIRFRFSLSHSLRLSAMHRAALRVPLRHALAPQRRSFVSTVLLTKAWENETVSELKKEARRRGLSSYVASVTGKCTRSPHLDTARAAKRRWSRVCSRTTRERHLLWNRHLRPKFAAPPPARGLLRKFLASLPPRRLLTQSTTWPSKFLTPTCLHLRFLSRLYVLPLSPVAVVSSYQAAYTSRSFPTCGSPPNSNTSPLHPKVPPLSLK